MISKQVLKSMGLKMLFCGFLLPALFLRCENGEIAQPVEENGPVRRIVFAARNTQDGYKLYTINDDGTELKEIFSGAKSIGDLWVSHKGDRVVCVVDTSMSPYANDQLLVLGLDGGRATQITHLDKAVLEEPQWFPNDEEVLFGYFGSWRGAQFFHIRADGSNMTRITTDDNTSHRLPRLSPDGQKIAFENRNSQSDVWVMNLDGAQQIPLSMPGEQAYLFGWTRDGEGILYGVADQTGDNSGLWVAEHDGAGKSWVCDSYGWVDISGLDGKIVIGLSSGILTINPDGSGLARLTYSRVEGYPILWAPDGTKIAFRGDVNGDGKYGICVISARGSGLREITDPRTEVVPAAIRAFDWVP
jgi:Tol biopolymer transport system component